MDAIGDRLRGRLASPPDEPPAGLPDRDSLDRALSGAGSGDFDAARELWSLLSPIGRHADADLVVRRLAEAGPRLWLTVDAAARSLPWGILTSTDVAAHRLVAGRAGPLDLIAAACHPDGFVREAAVTVLGSRDNVSGVPVLALRAADWVPEVRAAARRACARQLDRAPTEAIALAAPVARAVHARRDGDWLLDAVADVLRDGPPEALEAALAAEDRGVRRLAHTIGLAAGRLHLDRLVRTAETGPDPSIRVLCAEAAIRAAGDRDVPRRLLAAGTAMVRAEAVRALAAAGEMAAVDAALVDTGAVVRATAQALLRRAGTDPAARYRALLDRRPPLPTVIAGLGETGAHVDVEPLREWLGHPSSRGRAVTVRALRRLGETTPGLLLPLLTDPVSSVTRQVVLSLLRHADGLDEDFLRPLLRPERPPHVQRAAYRLLRAHGLWTRIGVDLDLLADPGHPLHATARADLSHWLAHEAATAYAVPPASRVAELSALLADVEEIFGTDTRLLRFHIGLPI
ncbi:HEAT repeat domain-containing protein [Saccharothrix violaceirubra]|uniref:HEAT repeat protein n=1 Tax=Saccharothrix violaceirubra TaxID=413306 RepID=A0A7W7WWE9_9PSEU|nr:hypothetical protein [Saccharothrix violaceirubra]MBB4966304.1 hypothetical protein [Saccharothrix violaceirubra]